MLISIGFVGCWAPYGIVSLWSVYRPGDSIPAEVSMLPCLFAKTSTVYNPFIYYIFSKTFKREVNQLSRFCGKSNICRTSNAKNRSENTIYLVCDVNKSKPGAEDLSLVRSKENETQMMPNQDLHEWICTEQWLAGALVIFFYLVKRYMEWSVDSWMNSYTSCNTDPHHHIVWHKALLCDTVLVRGSLVMWQLYNMGISLSRVIISNLICFSMLSTVKYI